MKAEQKQALRQAKLIDSKDVKKRRFKCKNGTNLTACPAGWNAERHSLVALAVSSLFPPASSLPNKNYLQTLQNFSLLVAQNPEFFIFCVKSWYGV